MRNDVFEDIAVLCQRVNKQVGEVFCSPETVMAKLIQSIFENKIQVHNTLVHINKLLVLLAKSIAALGYDKKKICRLRGKGSIPRERNIVLSLG